MGDRLLNHILLEDGDVYYVDKLACVYTLRTLMAN
jgi:hypothetical protein